VAGEGRETPRNDSAEVRLPAVLEFAGFRYWTASLLPALAGTTLPFWLRPRTFTAFNWLGAFEFLVATVLFHSGFSLLNARFGGRSTPEWSESKLLGAGAACIGLGSLIGLHLNTFVPGVIFVAFGLSVILAGVLYVAPPFRFCCRPFGEVIISIGLGMLPVLGAYLVQAGELTRTVYIASLPMVSATALWVWTGELVTRVNDEKSGRGTLVVSLGSAFSGRFVVIKLAILVYATLFLAVFTASMIPLALVAVLSFGLVRTVVAVSWNEHMRPKEMVEARTNAFKLHLAMGIIIACSALAAVGS
jgi:1,4-dihydroxy-2-naphthoate octaprenyltransferase